MFDRLVVHMRNRHGVATARAESERHHGALLSTHLRLCSNTLADTNRPKAQSAYRMRARHNELIAQCYSVIVAFSTVPRIESESIHLVLLLYDHGDLF